MATSIELRKLEHFVRRDLKRRLADDIMRTKMLREADLQACVYTHICRFLEGDGRWRVFGCRYVRRIGAFLDLLIFHDGVPQIAMELKWKRRQISRKDRRSLNRALKELRLRKVYFLTTAERQSSYTKLGPKKRAAERYRLHEIVVVPNCSSAELDLLNLEKRRYKEFAA